MATTLNYGDNMWDQFEKVVKRLQEGRNFSEEVAGFIQKRALLEKEYSQKLQRLVKSITVDEFATLGAAWTSVRAETEKLAQWHDQFGDRLVVEVKDLVMSHMSEQKKQGRVLVDQGNKYIKELEAQTEKRDKAKASFYRARRKQDDTQDEFDRASLTGQPASIVQKMAKKVTKDEKAAIKADTAYKATIASLVEAQVRMYDTDMPKTMSDLQRLEVTRLEVAKSSLEHVVDLQRGLIEQVTEHCAALRTVVQAVNSSADIVAFVERSASGKEKPPKAEYEPYDPKGDPKSWRLSVAAPILSPGSGGSRPASLSFSTPQGNTLTVPNNQPGLQIETLTAVDRAHAAVTPRTATAVAVTPRTATTVAMTPKVVPQVRALFDYAGETESELSFRQGDIIKLTEKDESGWWQGELNGVLGAFPSGWVEEISSSQAAASPTKQIHPQTLRAPPPSTEKRVRALYAFVAEHAEEIHVNVADVLTVEVDDGSGWMYGTNLSSSERGRFPANYVEYL